MKNHFEGRTLAPGNLVHLVALGLNAVHAQQAVGSQIFELPKLCGVIKFQVKDQTVLAFKHRRRTRFKKISDLPAVFLDLLLLVRGGHSMVKSKSIVSSIRNPLAELTVAYDGPRA